MGVSTRNPNCFSAFSVLAEELARKRARRGSRGDIQRNGEKPGNQDRRRFRARPVHNGYRRHKHKQRGAHGRIRRRVASAHRAVISGRLAVRAAIGLILLESNALAMVQRTIGGVAASGQVRGGKRFGKSWYTGHQQRKKRQNGLQFSRNLPNFHAASLVHDTRGSFRGTTAKIFQWVNLLGRTGFSLSGLVSGRENQNQTG